MTVYRIRSFNDTESNLIIVVLCVAVGVVGAASMLRRVRPVLTNTVVRATFGGFALPTNIPLAVPIPLASPPTILRV